MKKMKQWKTTNAYWVFLVLSGRSNAYLIRKGNQNVLVDTGKETAYKRLEKNLESLHVSKIDFLVLTHTHYDHCQNAKKMEEQFACKTIVSEKEKASVDNGYTPLPNGTIFISGLISKLGRLIARKPFEYSVFTPDLLLNGQMDLHDSDLDIKLIETPGHSAGSISIIIDNEIALVGDAMFGIFRNSVFPPFADNAYELIKSWRRLLNTSCHLFLPGHGKAIKRELLHQEYNKRKMDG